MSVTDAAGSTDLVVERLHSWYGSAHVLFDVDLRVPQGRTLALLGRNGAGKTTLLRSIARGLVRTSGRVAFGTHEVHAMRADEAARCGIQLVPEDRRIFTGLTVEENLHLGRHGCQPGRKPTPVQDLLDLFPLLVPLLSRRGFQLSGGEQQLLAVARALVANPSLLLLDEPSEGLAPRIVEELGTGIRLVQQNLPVTVVLAEQNVRFATDLADDVLVIDDGRVAFHGSVPDFAARPDIRDRYLKV